MSEDSNEQEQSLREIDGVAKMTRWEKCGFWYFPVFWALSAGTLFLVLALIFVGYLLILLLHFRTIIHHPGGLKDWGSALALVAGLLLISGAVLIYPVSVFRKMPRRKKQTGSPYPSGEELIARRYRDEHPPVWRRILVILFFSWIALGATHSIWASRDRRVLAAWSVPGTFWLLAIMAAVDSAWPKPGRKWTGFVVSGALGLTAILATVAIVRHGQYIASNWLFPLLMAFGCVGFAVVTVREGKKKTRPSSPSVSTPAATA
jgi:hypothetical protein